MKKQLLILTAIIGLGSSTQSQTIADFENLSLTPGSYWTGNASAVDTNFTSGHASFSNKFSSYWVEGWAYSNVQDSTTVGFTNNYGARPGIGYGGSANYAVGKNGARVKLTSEWAGKQVDGLYITNGTYAALSMENGDQFAKKFGGATGDDPDYFLLTVKAFAQGALTSDSVNFYLADFRFSDNSQDYIVKDWQYVDLQSLGYVDSLQFNLTSSDVGQWGMNTPAFFCIDNFTTSGVPISVQGITKGDVKVYPNPAIDEINVSGADLNSLITVWDVAGVAVARLTASSAQSSIDISTFKAGLYFVNTISNGTLVQRKVVKQ